MSTEALERLRDALREVDLELELPDAPTARHVRTQLVEQVDDYLLPRMRQLDAPLLMVVGGSTGAGKSTIVNSLVGREVSPAGVLRPTTRTPVLACNPSDLHWFESARVLPELSRTTGGGAGARGLELVPTAALAEGVALLDSPDIDSVAHENRALADQLLAAADTWLFVTTAARYADAVPWELLQEARDRGTVVAVVLNRVPPDASEVATHLRGMLDERGLDDTELLVVPESRLENGLLPAGALAPVRDWLDGLTADAQARSALIARTLAGALASIPGRVDVVANAVEAQAAAVEGLRAQVESAYEQAGEEVEETLRSGALLRGEVLARWYEVVGTGDLMRALESRVSWARDRLRSLLTGKPSAGAAVTEAVETGVESVVLAAAARAAERVADSWRQLPAGRTLLPGRARDSLRHARADDRPGGARLAGRRVRAGSQRGDGQADDRAARVPRRERRGADGDARRVPPDGRPHRRRGRDRRRDIRARPEGARGDLRRPGGPRAGGEGAREPARARPAPARGRGEPFQRAARAGGSGGGLGGAAAGAGGDRRVVTTTLDSRLSALADAAELAAGRLDEEDVATARAAVAKAGARLGLGLEETVVALAGPTGAGKSSLFNELAGAELTAVGRRRPTTAAATGAVWGAGGDALLDWLEIPRRHRLPSDELDGLVLLDLPDFDSVERDHRLEVDRLVELVDLVVWVVDPQKYADAAWHDDYVRPLARVRRVDGGRFEPVGSARPGRARGMPGRPGAVAGGGRRRGGAGACRLCGDGRGPA